MVETVPIVSVVVGWFQDSWWTIQIISVALSLVLLVAIVRYFIKASHHTDKREHGIKISDYKSVAEQKPKKVWGNILEKIKSPNSALWEEAFNQADALLLETLRAAGYKGFNAEQVFAEIGEEEVPGIKELKKDRSELIEKMDQEGYKGDREEIKRILRIYRSVLQKFGPVE